MPHVWDMLSRYTEPDRRGSDREIWRVVLAGAWYSFRLALLGFALGVVVGLALAVLMARFRVVERGLLPYLVVVADGAVDRARAARRQLGRQGAGRRLGVAALAVGIGDRRLPGLLPRRRRRAPRAQVAAAPRRWS